MSKAAIARELNITESVVYNYINKGYGKKMPGCYMGDFTLQKCLSNIIK